jgi:hypothetical protein
MWNVGFAKNCLYQLNSFQCCLVFTNQQLSTEQAAMQQMFVECCWAVGSRPVGCLDGDDVYDATTEEKSQAVFSVSPLGGYIIRLTKLSLVSAASAV